MTIRCQCLTCKHFNNDKSWSCLAYEKIPDRVLFNQVIHKVVEKDQKGEYVYSGDFPIEDPVVYEYFDKP